MNKIHYRSRPIMLLLSFVIGLVICAFAAITPAKAEVPSPPTVSEVLCNVGLIPCGGPALPTAPASGQPIVTASIVASAPECYAPARLYVDSVVGNDAVVYMVESYGWSFDLYRLNAGSGFNQATWTSNYPEYMPVVAVASASAPEVVLYAFRLVSPPCIEPPLPPARPYPTPVIATKVDCGKQAKVEVALTSSPDIEPVSVIVSQSPLKGAGWEQSWTSVTLGGSAKASRLRLPWSVKDAPIVVSAYDSYGEVLAPMVLVPKKGCKLTYDPTTILLPYGGK